MSWQADVDAFTWQAARVASRQRHAAFAERQHLARSALSRAASRHVHLPPLLLASRLDVQSTQDREVRRLVADMETSIDSFADLEEELQAVRVAARVRHKRAQRKQRTTAGKVVRRSQSDSVLFFDPRHHRHPRPSSPKLQGPTLPPLPTAGNQGKRYSQAQGNWGQRYELRADGSDCRALGGRAQLDNAEGAPPLSEQLRRILQQHLLRALDLFRRWDEDGSGDVQEQRWTPGPLGCGAAHCAGCGRN